MGKKEAIEISFRGGDGSFQMPFLTQTGQHPGELTTNYD